MAAFKSHISFGVLTAIALTFLLGYFSIISGFSLFIVFTLTVIGSMLPDIDSDSGLPVRLLFLSISIALATLSLFYIDSIYSVSLLEKGLISIGCGLGTYFIAGNIFKYFTVHRGIFHSIPASLVFGLAALSLSSEFGFGDKESLSFGLAVSVGYLCHLLLDELNSTTNLAGGSFLPKKSLGTAMQLWAPSVVTSSLMYMLLFILLFHNKNIIINSI